MGLPPKEPSCIQVPIRQSPLTVVSEQTLAKSTLNGQPVHVWTIDDVATMEELISLGIQGIMTDQSLVLREVLLWKHNLWRQ
jgi:glycerophosphoryl diester phosphodiesterase